MMQTGTVIGITDIHTRSFADSIEPLKDFDIGGVVAWNIAHSAYLLSVTRRLYYLFNNPALHLKSRMIPLLQYI